MIGRVILYIYKVLLFYLLLELFANSINFYEISSRSIYINKEAIVIAGKTKPTKGTKMEGK